MFPPDNEEYHHINNYMITAKDDVVILHPVQSGCLPNHQLRTEYASTRGVDSTETLEHAMAVVAYLNDDITVGMISCIVEIYNREYPDRHTDELTLLFKP